MKVILSSRGDLIIGAFHLVDGFNNINNPWWPVRIVVAARISWEANEG
jgi:hypothetical protein